MPRKKVQTEVENDPDTEICLVHRDQVRGDYWPLASFMGGVDKISVDRRGDTTIIKIVSPAGGIYLDVPWKRPKREFRSRRASENKPGPT